MSDERGIVMASGTLDADDVWARKGSYSVTGHTKRRIEANIDSILNEVRNRLIEAAHPDKIILFGSYARGDFDKDSDLDLLVILQGVESRFDEMVRLREVLGGIPLPIDLVVYSIDEVERRKELRGTMLFHALREGRVLHDAA